MSDRRRSSTDQPFVHFLTFSVFAKRRLLDLGQPKRIVLGYLNHQLNAMSGQCVGFVLMPDHVHALVWLPNSNDLRRFVHGWKRMSAFELRQGYAAEAPHYFAGFGAGEHFWKPKYYGFQIYSEPKLREKLDYIHLNPVRAGLVTRAVDWPWSSARWYNRQQSVGMPVSWVG